MADIRKRTGAKGTTYQVRYPSEGVPLGYAYATFATMKEARAFLESGKTRSAQASRTHEVRTVADAADLWLRICEKEGLNGREPVTHYTFKNYEYRVRFISKYAWRKPLHELTSPDIVAFRSWLLETGCSRAVASKVLSTLHSIMKEMTIRGLLSHNVASGICVRSDSRYQQPVAIPSKRDVLGLLQAADRLANSTNLLIARTWQRYRPILYLAADSGMRPQEYLALARSAIRENGVLVDRAIDGSGREITVTKTASGRRFIELSPDTIEMVRRFADHHAVPNKFDLVFPAANGRWMCRRNWQRRGFNVACVEAGLVELTHENGEEQYFPKYRPYDLRHFYASMLIEKGINLKKIQTLMGHTNIETTLNVYGHLLEQFDNSKIQYGSMLTDLISASCGEFVARVD